MAFLPETKGKAADLAPALTAVGEFFLAVFFFTGGKGKRRQQVYMAEEMLYAKTIAKQFYEWATEGVKVFFGRETYFLCSQSMIRAARSNGG